MPGRGGFGAGFVSVSTPADAGRFIALLTGEASTAAFGVAVAGGYADSGRLGLGGGSALFGLPCLGCSPYGRWPYFPSLIGSKFWRVGGRGLWLADRLPACGNDWRWHRQGGKEGAREPAAAGERQGCDGRAGGGAAATAVILGWDTAECDGVLREVLALDRLMNVLCVVLRCLMM